MKIIDHTTEYDGQKYKKLIENLICHVQKSDLENVITINIYDHCPSHYPLIAQGAYWIHDSKDNGAIDLYLDQCFGHMLSYHQARGLIQKVSDRIFVFLFGNKHLTDTLFHEIGHLVYEKRVKRVNQTKSEKFAVEYATRHFNKVYRSLNKHYDLVNGIYHFLYKKRIQHDNNKRKKL